MRFEIDNLPIVFPYDKIYPEQYKYMCDLKRTLDAAGHCVLEMPSGTGKTVSLLSLIVSYQQFFPTKRKLIYCSRTVPEIEKALTELKRLMMYRIEAAETEEQKEKERSFTGIGLTSRKNLCLNPQVSTEKKGYVVDAKCRDLTNAAACEKGRANPGSVPLCDWHEGLNEMEPGNLVPPGIWTLADLMERGRKTRTCPYFTVRRMMPFVDIIIYSFHYLLDPKVAEQVSKELSKDAIVVFDEAHNIETPLSFLQHLKDITFIERRPLRFCAERLQSLIRTLELSGLDEYYSLQKVASFATLVATYETGFQLILEPFETDNATIPNPIFHLICLDPSFAIKPIFERFSSVVITSGTISPLDMYPKMLQFTPVVQETYPMTLTRNCFLPLVITRGSDQVAISSQFEVRNDPAVVRNFGSILIEYSKIVPDGVVAFFPSYLYMESIVAAWNDMGILDEVWKHKLIFVETPDANETSIALENYRRACNNGRGAVLLSVARGKVSEGIDFDHNYGRAVIMFGVPYQYTESRILRARLEYLRDTYRIREAEFLGFDAMRNAAQCVGRVLRGKTDWGLMVFADRRFARSDKRSKLPKWINQYITENASNLSTDMAVVLSKAFMRTISQNTAENLQTGVSLWTLEDVLNEQLKAKQLEAMDAEPPSVGVRMEIDNNESDEYDDTGLPDHVLAVAELEL
ncbi:hypothetical protein FRC20_008500 [Serendipita sp. 405]|nr:hypothetical protein FRC20_008500 [Serendipita sp. 405]